MHLLVFLLITSPFFARYWGGKASLTTGTSKIQSKMEDLRSILGELGQEHIFEHIPEMSESHPIFKQLSKLDLRSSLRNFDSARSSSSADLGNSTISPVDKVFNWETADSDEKRVLEKVGRECIQQGKAAAIILSGGQGTRLGFAGPKGMYNMGLVSGKSIFQLHIERLAKIRSLSLNASGEIPSIPIYVMTSDMNDSIIKDYFISMDYFGYPKDDVFFFEQGLEPCLTFDGKIIIDSDLSLSLAPDGNGGMLIYQVSNIHRLIIANYQYNVLPFVTFRYL